MEFSVAELAALEAGTVQYGLFFRLMTADPLYLWLGAGKIEPGINDLDIAGQTYHGAGELVNLPAFQQLINGATETLTFTLSGASEATIDIATSADVKGVQCNTGIGIMDQNWSLLGPLRWPKTYFADFVGVSEQPQDDLAQPILRTVNLVVSDPFASRRRARNSYWTNQDQQTRSPGDKFCERVQLASPWAKVWPPPPVS